MSSKPTPERKARAQPSESDQQIQIARVPDDTIDTACDQRTPGLNGYQPAEPVPERKDWPDPQRTACSEENDAKPANGITIESADLLSVCMGRQISGQQPDQPEGTDDPAIATILAHTGAQISSTENGNTRQHEKCDREGNQGRVREEGSKPSPAEDDEVEINEGRYVVMSANLGVVIVAGLSRQSFFQLVAEWPISAPESISTCQVDLQPWIAHP